jgi:hypothetical protein
MSRRDGLGAARLWGFSMGKRVGLLLDGRWGSLAEVLPWDGLILPGQLGGWMGGDGGGVVGIGGVSGACLGERVYRGEGDGPIAVGRAWEELGGGRELGGGESLVALVRGLLGVLARLIHA